MVYKKVLVLGAAGFIGSNIIENLIKKNNYKITATFFKKKPKIKFKNLNYQRVNLINYRNLKKIDQKYDLIFMCAGKIFNKRNSNSLKKLKENLMINKNVINFLLRNTKSYIWFNSCSGYPKNKGKLTETDFFKTPAPKKILPGMQSREIEKELFLISKTSNVNILTIRTPEVYGKFDNYNENTSRDIPLLINCYLNKLKKKHKIDTKFQKGYIFASDLAKYTIRLSSIKMKKYEAFNLCDDKSYNLQRLINFLKIDTDTKNSKIKKDNYKNPQYQRAYDNKKVKKVLGIRKIGNLEKSIKKTIIWYKQLA